MPLRACAWASAAACLTEAKNRFTSLAIPITSRTVMILAAHYVDDLCNRHLRVPLKAQDQALGGLKTINVRARSLPGVVRRRVAAALAPRSPRHQSRAALASCAEPAALSQTSCDTEDAAQHQSPRDRNFLDDMSLL